jgi:hypothetical protein
MVVSIGEGSLPDTVWFGDSCEERGKIQPDPFELRDSYEEKGWILLGSYEEKGWILLDPFGLEHCCEERGRILPDHIGHGDSCEERGRTLPDPLDLEMSVRRGAGSYLIFLDLKTAVRTGGGSCLILLNLEMAVRRGEDPTWSCGLGDGCEKTGRILPDPFGLEDGCEERGQDPTWSFFVQLWEGSILPDRFGPGGCCEERGRILSDPLGLGNVANTGQDPLPDPVGTWRQLWKEGQRPTWSFCTWRWLQGEGQDHGWKYRGKIPYLILSDLVVRRRAGSSMNPLELEMVLRTGTESYLIIRIWSRLWGEGQDPSW